MGVYCIPSQERMASTSREQHTFDILSRDGCLAHRGLSRPIERRRALVVRSVTRTCLIPSLRGLHLSVALTHSVWDHFRLCWIAQLAPNESKPPRHTASSVLENENPSQCSRQDSPLHVTNQTIGGYHYKKYMKIRPSSYEMPLKWTRRFLFLIVSSAVCLVVQCLKS